jgi:hypothetical protein
LSLKPGSPSLPPLQTITAPRARDARALTVLCSRRRAAAPCSPRARLPQPPPESRGSSRGTRFYCVSGRCSLFLRARARGQSEAPACSELGRLRDEGCRRRLASRAWRLRFSAPSCNLTFLSLLRMMPLLFGSASRVVGWFGPGGSPS